MKQNNIFKHGFLKTASWIMAHTSWLTMAFSPVAMGKEAEAKSVEYYKQYVHEIGLDKKITAQQFWDKVKNDLPGYAYFEIEQAIKNNPNALMPEFQVKSSKASDGTVIPVLSFNDNGKIHTIQIYGEKDKYLKFNNTFVSENDAKQPATLFQKLIDSDSKLNQKYKEELTKLHKSNFAQFSSMNKDLWKKMTPQQRVSYFIQMRMMYLDARKVIELNDRTTGKKTSSFNYLEMIFKALMNEAEAQNQVNLFNTDKTVTIAKDAKTCVVAGYIGNYIPVKNAKGQVKTACSVDVAISKYEKNSELKYVTDANTLCTKTNGSNARACNPIIYGTPGGSPLCIDKYSDGFQKATHFEGPCDTASRLSYSKNVVDTQGKDYSKISPPEARNAAIKADQKAQDFQLSKEFLDGVLAGKSEELRELFQKGEWSQALEDEIRKIGKQFDAEITSAQDICRRDFSNQIDKNQKEACDQLHRRALFYDEVIAGLKKPEVKTDDPKVIATVECANDDQNCNEKLPVCDQYPPLKVGTDLNDDCTCKNAEGKNGNFPKEDQPGLFAKLFNTKKNKEFKATSTENRIHSCKFGPNWWAVAGIGLGVAGIVTLLLIKTKTKTKTIVNNTVTNNPICKTPPKTYWTGSSCECAPCGVYYMANGTSQTIVPNPLTCACTAPPTEGGTGTNTDSDSGGVPVDAGSSK